MGKLFTNEEYLRLITSEYADKPKFNAYVEAFLKMLDPAVSCAESFNSIFNLENAVGDQLDKIGSLLSLGRELPFVDPDIPSVLPDRYYRMVLKGRVYSNHWDGTMQGLANIIHTIYPDAAFNIVDGQNMSYQVVIIEPGSDLTLSALMFHGYIIPKPSGVRVNYTILERPLFGYDSNTSFVKGWDYGSWSNE